MADIDVEWGVGSFSRSPLLIPIGFGSELL